jgi:hypothetical protein
MKEKSMIYSSAVDPLNRWDRLPLPVRRALLSALDLQHFHFFKKIFLVFPFIVIGLDISIGSGSP